MCKATIECELSPFILPGLPKNPKILRCVHTTVDLSRSTSTGTQIQHGRSKDFSGMKKVFSVDVFQAIDRHHHSNVHLTNDHSP